ncbi:VOC family protein [Patulibacter minatonensis]|uniref:VOC family protein n=1 Tax=Patulibacter minatonensis TaxID=298163 RepID=UPI00047CBECA|nr:VOC family protein [Patulibacter minatonensis]
MRMIFPNLPVTDVKASRAFFSALGFGFNEQFCDETTACLVIEENIMVMLIEEEKFRTFIKGDIAPRDVTESMIALSCDSKDEVLDLAGKAKAAGAEAWKDPQDYGFMYGESFRDLDGHVWELMWMDLEQAQAAQEQADGEPATA